MIAKKYLEEKYASDLDFEGRLVILREDTYKKEYQEPKYLIVRATGGFGCRADALGRAVYYKCPFDNERAGTDRHQVQYVIKEEYEQEVLEKYCR